MTTEFPDYRIGFTLNKTDRYNATSGGIGTAVTRYLLSGGEYGTALSFRFNSETVMFEPVLIYDEKEINVCGSIYQDMDILSFIKENIAQINGGIIASVPPCQVAALRIFLDNKRIKSFIISFCCSGQTTVEGTWQYYNYIGVRKSDVIDLQYRGKGWPSGIQIRLKDGTTNYRDNWTEPWISIQSSGFYKPKRCFYCQYDTSRKSDISLADPWLPGYISSDKVGHTLFLINTEQGSSVISEMKREGLIEVNPITYETYFEAQRNNVGKKDRVNNQKHIIRITSSLAENIKVKKFFTKSFSRMRFFLSIRRFILVLSNKLHSGCNIMR